MTAPPTDLSHVDTRWLHGLARQLVRDAAVAEDLTQEALLAAVRQPAGAIADLRGWLVGVVRNTARLWHRDRARRTSREATVAASRSGTSEATDVLVARLQEQRILLEVLAGLAEPYRGALLMRYFESLPPRRIAARLGIPVATVHTRLKRGLAQMRDHLGKRYGSQRAWIAALTTLGARFETGAGTLASILLMHANAKLVLLGSLLVGGLVGLSWTLSRGSQEPAEARRAEALPASTLEGAEPRLVATEAPSEHRTALAATPTSGPSSVAVAAGPPRAIRGRALLPDGTPLVGARIAFAGRPAQALATTGSAGDFVCSVRDTSGEIVVAEPGYVTVYAGLANGAEDRQRILVAARSVLVDGHVLDQNMKGLEGAQVAFAMPDGFRTRFPIVLDESAECHRSRATGPGGAFRFEECPLVPGARIVASRDGYRPASTPVAEGARGVSLVLAQPSPKEGALAGRVADARGLPIPGAFVSAGRASAETDGLGEFVLDLAQVGAAKEVAAIAHGLLPARVPLTDPSRYLILRLEGTSESLSGTLVDARGKPLPGRRLWIADPAFFGYVEGAQATAEGIASGGARMSELQRAWEALQGLQEEERAARMPPDHAWSWVLSDADGRFRIAGLQAREYSIHSLDQGTLLHVDHGRFAAGRQDLRLVEDAGALFPTLEGRVVDEAGKPIKGVLVQIATTVLKVQPPGGSEVRRRRTKLVATSAADGSFALANVPRGAFLRITGDRIVPLECGSEERGGIQGLLEGGRLTITAVRRCHLRVELTDPAEADAIQILDRDGKPIEILSLEGTNTYSGTLRTLHEGKSGSLVVSSKGKTLVLVKAQRAVRRIELTLDPERESIVKA